MVLRQEEEIISSWNKINFEEPEVSIVCHAFNHENFLEQAIKGFLSQKTNFSFEIILHDDASTDGTKAIIEKYQKSYPKIIFSILQKENQYSQKRSIGANFTFPKCKGKYIAMCEGDDFWTDEFKLQKQYDFLEKNLNYVVCWTNYNQFDGNSFIETGFDKLYPEVYTLDLENVFDYYITYTLTVFFKREALDYKALNNFKYVKDNTLYSLLLVNGKGAFLNFKSAVYRWHEGGVFSLRSEFFKKYSSHLNIKEIYDKIDAAKTKSMKFIYTELYRQAAEEALKMYACGESLTKEQKSVLNGYFFSLSFIEKIRFIKKYYNLKKNFKLGV